MTTVYIAFVMCTHSLSSLFPALLIVEHIEGVSDSLCVAQKQGADERVVIFSKNGSWIQVCLLPKTAQRSCLFQYVFFCSVSMLHWLTE